MTEKQYKFERWTSESLYYSFPTGSVHQGIGYVIEKVEKDLNQLAEENEELKDARASYKKDWKYASSRCDTLEAEIDTLRDNINGLIEENKELKQFQDRVFSWIDMHLQRLPTLRDDEFESDNEFADPSLYSGAIQILETMKRELKGDME